MSTENDNRPDELLTRAVAASRKLARADGPPPEVVARTLAALHEAALRPRQTLRHRLHDMSWRIKAVTLTGAVAAALVLSFMLLAPGGNSLALGQVIEKLRTARCISLIVEMHFFGPNANVTKQHLWLMDADKSRSETNTPDGKVTMISNGNQVLRLDPSAKTAVVGKFPPGPRVSSLQSLEQLRSLVDKDGHSLGEKTIGGIRAKGFEVLKNGRKITLWANAESGNPIRIEYPLIEIPPPAGPALQVLTDFKFDEEFDPALFSVEVPAGYTVSDFAKKYLLPMEHMVAILKLYSQRTGQFPPGVEDNGRAIATGFGVPEAKDTRTAEQRELMDHIEGLQLFFKAGKPGQDFQYYPDVKLGEKDRVVFWCKSPAVNAVLISLVPNPDSPPPAKPDKPDKPAPDKFVAVYGDLRVENLTKDQLPPNPPEDPPK